MAILSGFFSTRSSSCPRPRISAMEKLLTLTGDDFWRSCSRLIGLLKSRNRFIFNDLRGGGLGEPTETSELAGLGVLCGISRCIFLWPLSTSWLYPYGLAPNSFLRAIKNASAKRAAVTRKTSAQRATQTPTTKMARGQNAMLMLLGSLSLFLGQALSTGFWGLQTGWHPWRHGLAQLRSLSNWKRRLALAKGACQQKRERWREGELTRGPIAVGRGPYRPPHPTKSRCQRANVINLYNLTCALFPPSLSLSHSRSLSGAALFPSLSRRFPGDWLR